MDCDAAGGVEISFLILTLLPRGEGRRCDLLFFQFFCKRCPNFFFRQLDAIKHHHAVRRFIAPRRSQSALCTGAAPPSSAGFGLPSIHSILFIAQQLVGKRQQQVFHHAGDLADVYQKKAPIHNRRHVMFCLSDIVKGGFAATSLPA